jgi:hypothetical protein
MCDLTFQSSMQSHPGPVFTIGRCVVAGLSVMNWVFWLYRLSAFRKDRRWEGSMFGEPFDLGWEVLDPSRYIPAGWKTYAVFLASTIILWAELLAIAYWSLPWRK